MVSRSECEMASQLRFGAITRGQGKVYIGLSGVNHPDRLSVRASFQGGGYVPVSLLKLHTGDVVVVYPDFKPGVSLSVCRNEGLDSAEEISAYFEYRQIRNRSRINTLIKNQDALRIRNCDNEPQANCILFHDVRLISAGDEEIVQFTLEYPAEREPDRSPVHVSCVDETGSDIALRTFDVLGETLVHTDDLPGLMRRVVRCSCSIRAGVAKFYLMAHSSGDVQDGIYSAFPELVVQLRESWRQLTLPAYEDPGYNDWFIAQRALPCDLRSQRVQAKGCPSKSFFTLIVSASVFTPGSFEEFACSLSQQTYDNSEAVVFGSEDELGVLAHANTKLDVAGRINYLAYSTDSGMSNALLMAIEQGHGDHFCFLGNAGTLEPDALYWIAESFMMRPDLGMLYCDEDELSSGRYIHAWFKPDWDSYLLESQYYLGSLLVLSFEALRPMLPALREARPSWLYRIALLAVESNETVWHLRRVLFHSLGARALVRELSCRTHIGVSSDRGLDLSGSAQFQDGCSIDAPLAFVPYGECSEEELKLKGESLTRSLGCSDWPVIPLRFDIDDASSLSRLMRVIESCGCEQVFVFDATASMDRFSLDALMAQAARPHVGAVSANVVYRDGTMRGLGMLCSDKAMATPILHCVPRDSRCWDDITTSVRQVSAVGSGAVCLKRSAVLQSSWDCAGAHPLLWAEDLSMALREKGWAVLVEPSAVVKVAWSSIELFESNYVISNDRLHAHASLRRRWPQCFSKPDPFYNERLRWDGYYGLLAHE